VLRSKVVSLGGTREVAPRLPLPAKSLGNHYDTSIYAATTYLGRCYHQTGAFEACRPRFRARRRHLHERILNGSTC